MELNKIYNIDCLEGLKQLKDNSIDLIITDPPYGIGESSKNHESRGKRGFGGKSKGKVRYYGKNNWDDERPDKEIFDEMFRVAKNLVIFGGNYFIDYFPKASNCWIVWDKDNGSNDFADCELAYTTFNTAVRKFKFKWHGMLQGDMKNKEQRFHPTQKPQKLMQWVIKNYSKKTYVICDPFMGSGSTAVACKELGRDFIGFEINKEYCEIAKQRLKKVNNKKLKEWF